jgi:cell fate (sporulation/competence/biofilm development) regulator YlbF (YheA/YmcA/DUF963 family)
MYYGEKMTNSMIVEKAKELASMIENHEITVRYRESVEKMKNDATAQKLLAELVRLGGELNSMDENNTSASTARTELALMKDEFENNKTVKDHILAQKEYLDLIKTVQDKIKNPER